MAATLFKHSLSGHEALATMASLTAVCDGGAVMKGLAGPTGVADESLRQAITRRASRYFISSVRHNKDGIQYYDSKR